MRHKKRAGKRSLRDAVYWFSDTLRAEIRVTSALQPEKNGFVRAGFASLARATVPQFRRSFFPVADTGNGSDVKSTF